MLPLLIAEELLTVRKVITVARAVDLASDAVDMLSSTNTEKFDHQIVTDEDIYFYILIDAFLSQSQRILGAPFIEKINGYEIVTAALASPEYQSSAYDTNNRTNAFIHAFSQELAEDDTFDPASLHRLAQSIRSGMAIDALRNYILQGPDYTMLKSYLTEHMYSIPEFDAIINMFKTDYDSRVLQGFLTRTSWQASDVLQTDSLIANIISAISRYLPISTLQYSLPTGSFCPASGLIPMWDKPRQAAEAYVEFQPVLRPDIDEEERKSMKRNRGLIYNPKSRSYESREQQKDQQQSGTDMLLDSAVTAMNVRTLSRLNKGRKLAKADWARNSAKIGKSLKQMKIAKDAAKATNLLKNVAIIKRLR